MNRLLPASFVICIFLLIDLGHATSPAIPRTTNSEDTARPEDADRCDSHIVIGTPGAPGPAGPQGAPGWEGPTGYPGAPGHNGINGSPGAAGSRGLKGDAGEPGDPGVDGISGIPGAPGPQGPAGHPGERGAVGKPGSSGRPGVQGIKGERGLNGYPGDIGYPGLKGNQGFPGRKGECSCPIQQSERPSRRSQAKVAFSAARISGLQATDGPAIVTYENVFSNKGGSFNEGTGIFRSPVAGTYFFTMSIYKSSTEDSTLVQLMHNGDPIIGAMDSGASDTEDMATNSVVLNLEVGDEVHLQLDRGRELYSNNNYRLTTFTGFLLGA